MPGAARIHLNREHHGYTDRMRAYKVFIDGEQVGEVRRDDHQVYEVEPGPHVVELRIDWCRSQPLALELAAGEDARLTCRGRNPFLAPYLVTFGRRRYMHLERAR